MCLQNFVRTRGLLLAPLILITSAMYSMLKEFKR
jgi:hypothetical protein